MLALTQPAAGEIVVTKKRIQIPISSLGVEGVGISFANNGVDDLKLVLRSFSIFGANGNNLKAVDGAEGKGVVGQHSFRSYGSVLGMGAKIGPSANFVSAGPACKGSYFSYCGVELAATHTSSFGSRGVGGPWAGNPKIGYLGVRFLINGQTHYGWVHLSHIRRCAGTQKQRLPLTHTRPPQTSPSLRALLRDRPPSFCRCRKSFRKTIEIKTGPRSACSRLARMPCRYGGVKKL